MSYDPTQRVPPPQNYPTQQVPPPPQGYAPQQAYPPSPANTPQSAYPPQQGYPAAYQQAQPANPATYQQYTTPPQPGLDSPSTSGFDFAAFWKNLRLTGQVELIAGLILLIAFFMPWYSFSFKDPVLASYSATYTGSFVANNATGIAFLMWLTPLGAIVILATSILAALNKLRTQQITYGILGGAGAALLGEIVFLIKAHDSVDYNSTDYSAGPSIGFYLALLATLAIGGVYFYYTFMKKPAIAAAPLGAYQQPGQYPGSQPYQQQPTQYPGSQPYGQAPQYPSAPPQYPGSQPSPYAPPQYPGSQPPQYPPQ